MTCCARIGALISLLALAVGIGGCAEAGPLRDRTQANLVDKSVFEGEWWYMRTVVGIDDDAAWAIGQAGASAPWEGAMANFDIISNSGIAGRIRWVIDENYLYAYRSTEIVPGSASNADDDGYLGEPLAIFPIDEHVDVRREYVSSTGEPTNVISESSERRWYDRQYVRVDWSQNLVTWGLFGGLDLEGIFAQFRREPVAHFVQEGGDERVPESWRPTFVRIGDDPTYRYADEWPAEMSETVHYMSFVTNELWTPLNCLGTTCNSSLRLSIRSAFLRVPPNHEYAVETLPNSEYDRFGIIRTEQRTYIRGGEDRSTLGTYCDAGCAATCDALTCTSDADCGDGGSCQRGVCRAGTYANEEQCGSGGECTMYYDEGWGRAFATCSAGTREDADDCGVGTMCDYGSGTCAESVDADCGPGFCNVETNTCEGGLTPEYGETDFLTYYRLRHNMFSNSLTDQECTADWQCDGRYGEDAAPTGSRCDPAAGRCTVPLADRTPRTVSYHLSPGYPRHLVRSAFEVTAHWNQAFMRGNRALHGEPLPGEGADGTIELPRVTCQNTNPTKYCFCAEDGSTVAAEVADDGTCEYRPDFFVAPEERGVANPYQCWVAIVDAEGNPARETQAVNPTNPTSFDDYPEDVYRYAFVGDECLWTLKVNSCDIPVPEGQEPAACEALGDIRYQFFNYASGAGAGWCGVMQPVSDPLTGEAVSIPINMGGLCLEQIGNVALDLWPVLRGDVPEDTLYTGENVRGYFSNLGNVHVPVGYASSIQGAEYLPEDGSRPAFSVNLRGIHNQIQAMEPRLEQLRSSRGGRAMLFSDRLRALEGTELERRQVGAMAMEGPTAIASNNILTAMNVANAHGEAPDAAEMVEQLSPFRGGFDDLMHASRRRELALAEANIHYPREALFTARYNQYWAEAFAGRPLSEAQIRWMQAMHRNIMLHEMGHGLGLEHNFAGSFDRDNYADGYFALVTEQDENGDFPNALPDLNDFNCGEDGLCSEDAGYPGPDEGEADAIFSGAELTRWAETLRAARTARTAQGIGNYMTSSLMDYNGDLSDMAGLGHYDRAAVYFNYFNMVETFEGNPEFDEARGSTLEGITRSDITPRRLWSYYRGGEGCSVDSDCPYSEGSSALADGQRVYQRCVRNPRYSQIPEPCNGDRNCICSNFDEDVIDLAEQAYPGFNPDVWGTCGDGTRCADGDTCADGSTCSSDGIADYGRVEYMFCSNPRLNDISWCNVFDAGESFQEAVDHWRQMWQEGYPRRYFRNYRRGFSSGSRATRSIIDAAKMFQHLFFRYFNEPEFASENGPLGFFDQYFASMDAMNWLAELAQLPDVGSYRLRQIAGPADCPATPDETRPECRYGYEHMGTEMGMTGADMSLAPGEGYYHWSSYQDGLYGFFRMERAGVFWDKYIALRALTIRDWGLSFTVDERYFINFYSLFPDEMTELFGGYILDDPTAMAPRVRMEGGEPHVYYLNHMFSGGGACSDPSTGADVPCDGPAGERYPDPAILGTSNEILRIYAAVFSLAEFPVFYDTSFESRLAVFKMDSAEGFHIPDVQLDDEPTLAYNQAIPGSGHAVTTDPAEADYIVYTSDRMNAPYVAVKIREDFTFNLEENQLGFQLLLRLHQTQERVRALQALPSPTPDELAELTRLTEELARDEAFLETLIEVERIFGISSWL